LHFIKCSINAKGNPLASLVIPRMLNYQTNMTLLWSNMKWIL
jgi:hypothetical protein